MTSMHIDTADETAPTMAELIQRLLADQDLTEARRRNLVSSIRRFCAVLGIGPEQAPAVYPHLLRHFGATLYLTENPEGLDVVRRVLGHRSADTTYRSYAGVQDEIAVRRFDELVLGIRATILKELGYA